MGLGYVELVAMLEQMGKHLLCSPFFSTVCLGANALLIAGSEEQKTRWLTRLCEGELTATLAFNGGVQHWDENCITATWRREGDSFVLNGDYSGRAGISLFLLDGGAEGLKREHLPTMDQARKQAALSLNNVTLSADCLMGEPGEAWPQLSRISDLAAIALAAEQVGGCQQLLDMTVEYTGERVQFNRPIASFQAVKHKAADMMLKTEVARSAVYYAACVAQEVFEEGPMAGDLSEAASVAKSYCSDAYFEVAGDALQLFGGVGFTWEYDVHLYLKRAKSSEHMLGNGAQHRERLAAMLLDETEVVS
jgi:alkylation response protein AidB-like acyl-CoA dehydrogenase